MSDRALKVIRQRLADKLESDLAHLREMVEEIAKEEREACARLVDEMARKHDSWGNRGEMLQPQEIAAAIRARKDVT